MIAAAVVIGVGALLLAGWTVWELRHVPVCLCGDMECGGGCGRANTDHDE